MSHALPHVVCHQAERVLEEMLLGHLVPSGLFSD